MLAEFVTQQYRYSTFRQAVEIIRKALTVTDCIRRSNITYVKSDRIKLSNSVARFSAQHYKNNLRKIIISLFSQ
jgi:hypothetical protein